MLPTTDPMREVAPTRRFPVVNLSLIVANVAVFLLYVLPAWLFLGGWFLSITLFMGAVSGAHLNPGVSLAFAMRGDLPWRRVPGYIIAQFVGAILATLLLVALLGRQGSAGLTLPGPGITGTTALLWEVMLTTGLVSVILGTSSGAQAVGWGAAIGVGSFIALAGMIGASVSGASMNPARSLGPAILVALHRLVGLPDRPPIGAVIAVGIAYALRGSGRDETARIAASLALGLPRTRLGRIE